MPDPDVPSMPDEAGHLPVLLDEVLALLEPRAGQVMLDCTVGRGGHMRAIAPLLGPGGRYIGLDVDPANIDFLRASAAATGVTCDLVQANFADARGVLDGLGIDRVDLLLADLGFASTQMDDPSRGLSFTADAPLDMRLDPTLGVTAADLLAEADEVEIADILWRYGDERFSRAIARKIVEARSTSPIKTTRQFAELCAAVYARRAGRGKARWRIHPATRSFQALRIAVNDELGKLEALLGSVGSLLRAEGRAAIISFHSLEDRMVKHAFGAMADDQLAERLTRKPLVATEEETNRNPRSRSAKLRAIRWIGPCTP
jgi:16S rRNA (cytosine1402-N4)-methyltransferase